MPHHRFPTMLGPVCRPLLALSLAAALGTSIFAPAVPARADHVRDHRDPDARLQVVLKQVHIWNDEDTFGEGEIHLLAIVTECLDSRCVWQCAVPNDYCIADGPIFSQAILNFGANSGARVNLGDRLMPRADDAVFAATRAELGVSDEAGIPVHVGKHYQFGVLGWENDVGPFDFDTLGYLSVDMDESNSWGIGTYTRPSVQNDDGKLGDFEIMFEIRRTPLPDLVPQSIQGQLLDDGRPVVCASVTNAGERETGSFQMVLRADGADLPGGTFEVPGLVVGETFPHCFLVPTGQHRYAVSVDESRRVAEMNEYNNILEQAMALREAPPGRVNPVVGPVNVAPEAPTGAQQPATPRADLAVEAIRVKGEEPRGTNDCDPGKNDVTVVVKNDGTAAAAGFAVRVIVDGEDDEAKERTVAGVEAGKELDVRFDDIRLRRGLREVTATVDAEKAVAESDEDNNELKISVNCRGD